jgi:hypothetical protein
MHVATQWKTRPLSPEQTIRMMGVWASLQAAEASMTHSEQTCQFFRADGSGGFNVFRTVDAAAADAFRLEWMLALGEFLEIESSIVMTLDEALPSIMKAVEHISAG